MFWMLEKNHKKKKISEFTATLQALTAALISGCMYICLDGWATAKTAHSYLHWRFGLSLKGQTMTNGQRRHAFTSYCIMLMHVACGISSSYGVGFFNQNAALQYSLTAVLIKHLTNHKALLATVERLAERRDAVMRFTRWESLAWNVIPLAVLNKSRLKSPHFTR